MRVRVVSDIQPSPSARNCIYPIEHAQLCCKWYRQVIYCVCIIDFDLVNLPDKLSIKFLVCVRGKYQYHCSFVKIPHKFSIVKRLRPLSVPMLQNYALGGCALLVLTKIDSCLRIENFATMNLCGVSTTS